MKWIKRNEAVYGSDALLVTIDISDITMLKQNIVNTPDRRIRICTHPNSNHLLHEMIIVLSKGSYIRPHKHLNKSESFHIIEGRLDVVIFDEVGEISDVIEMGDFNSGKCFFYRLSAPCFHTLLLRSDLAIFHETTNGPFRKEETIFAPWSPEQDDYAGSVRFLLNLQNKIVGQKIQSGIGCQRGKQSDGCAQS